MIMMESCVSAEREQAKEAPWEFIAAMSILSLNHPGKAPNTECPIVHPVSKKHWT